MVLGQLITYIWLLSTNLIKVALLKRVVYSTPVSQTNPSSVVNVVILLQDIFVPTFIRSLL